VPSLRRIANARVLLPTADAQVTVFTCWPPWNNTQRLVSIARPAAP
jgi:sortase (surface protein transpeptidase)